MRIISWVIVVVGGKSVGCSNLPRADDTNLHKVTKRWATIWSKILANCSVLLSTTYTGTRRVVSKHENLVLPALRWYLILFLHVLLVDKYPKIFRWPFSPVSGIVCARRQGCQRHSAHFWLHVWWWERISARVMWLGEILRKELRSSAKNLIGIHLYRFYIDFQCIDICQIYPNNIS